VKKTDEVLKIGVLEATFEAELAARYDVLKLPFGPSF
jgi:hypothetical protein